MSYHQHNNGHLLSLGLLLILCACFATSLCRPATSNTEESNIEGEARPLSYEVDQARKMWNVAKQSYKKMQKRLYKPTVSRTKRAVDSYPEPANVTRSKYMLDLFRNLTDATKNVRTQTQANTIKSLTFVRRYPFPVPECDGEFNFTMAALNSSEFILQTKLRLYLEKIHLSSATYIVDIRAKHSNGNLSVMSVMKEIIPSQNGYVEFEVASLLRLLSSQDKHAVFKIFIYTTIENLKSQVSLTCGTEMKFIDTDVNETTMPTLIVYSYNPKVENIDYQKVSESIRLHSSASSTEASTRVQRRRRDINTLGACGVQPLHVLGSEIVPDLLGIDSSYTVHSPQSYNAGICGGTCISNLPSGVSSKHAPFIHVLLDINTFSDRHHLEFSQCCVPVKYKHLDVLFYGEGAVFISIIQNMIIDSCECIDIAV